MWEGKKNEWEKGRKHALNERTKWNSYEEDRDKEEGKEERAKGIMEICGKSKMAPL